jgi:hypothetical protein
LEIVDDPAFAEIIATAELAWLEDRINDVKPGKPTMPCLARKKMCPQRRRRLSASFGSAA